MLSALTHSGNTDEVNTVMNQGSRFLVCLAVLVTLAATSGCRAMRTHDLNGVHYQNENRSFYIPEKEATVNGRSFAYRWKSGDLTGSCSEIALSELPSALDLDQVTQVSLPTMTVDRIDISPAALFYLDSTNLTESGNRYLEQTIKRLKGYQNVFHIAVEGHTDNQGSVDYNQSLSSRRAQLIKNRLQEKFKQVTFSTKGFSELNPVVPNHKASQKQQNRRVSLTALTGKPSDVYTNSTLCIPSTHKNVSDSDYQQSLKTLQKHVQTSTLKPFTELPPLSIGDRVRVLIPQGDELSGIYEIGFDGAIALPFLGSVSAQGMNTPQLENEIATRLVEQQIFRINTIHVSVSVQEWAPIEVMVSGATFDPGRVTINRQTVELRQFKQTQISGDYTRDRLLSAALFSAGGIRPDANLQDIQIIRNGTILKTSLEGLFSGHQVSDRPLAAGDHIIVPTSGRFNGKLVKRTQITPPGIRIFISNLSTPATDNSKSAINGKSTSVPYGTRFLRGLVSGNCVGGTQLTNAARRAVLISTNPVTGETEVIERSVQQLVSDPDRDDINPFLMPNDGIACYDSSVTNFRDVTRTLSDFLAPVVHLNNLLR